MKPRIFKALGLLTLFGACYLGGATAAEMRNMDQKADVMSADVSMESQDWGLGFGKQGEPPTGMATFWVS